MKVRLLNFHCIIEFNASVENRVTYVTFINAMEIKEESLSIYLAEFS